MEPRKNVVFFTKGYNHVLANIQQGCCYGQPASPCCLRWMLDRLVGKNCNSHQNSQISANYMDIKHKVVVFNYIPVRNVNQLVSKDNGIFL